MEAKAAGVALPALRNAQRLIVAGEAVVIRVALRPQLAGEGPLDLASLADQATLTKLRRAGRKAVFTGMLLGYRIAVEDDAGLLVYRIEGYRNLESRNLVFPSYPGIVMERRVLRIMSILTRLVARIVSRSLGIPVIASASWTPGDGLMIAGGLSQGLGGDPGERIDELQRLQQKIRWRARMGVPIAILVVLFGEVARTEDDLSAPPRFVVIIYALVFVLMGWLLSTRVSETEREIGELRDQIDLRELLLEDKRELRAQKQFQVHSHQLRRYYEQALRQRGVIFAIGVLCIGAGFGVIVAAGLFVWLEPADLSTQIVVGALGAVGGILANFIAVVYLNMFKETVKSIGSFHDRLVVTNRQHFASVLAAKVGDGEMRDEVLAGMARAMAHSEPAHDASAGPD